MAILERTPEALLDFWLGRMRDPEEASGDNWRERMVLWRIGPFARSTEDRRFLRAQREWCEQIHREGIDGFFSDPLWETPRGVLAKLIVLDQFPRSAYRGTPTAYDYSSITEPIARGVCDRGWDSAEYNVIERMWVYMPLTHSEDLDLQELAVDKFIRWNQDLLVDVGPERRKLNQFVSWSFIKATIEHSEVLLIYGRFPHRNAILGRPHKGGEPRYLSDPMRPLWTFTQPPQPDYFSVLGALCRIEDGFDEGRIHRETLASLHRSADIPTDPSGSLMDVFEISGGDTVTYEMLYRHMRLPEKARVFEGLCRSPLIADLMNRVKGFILKDPEEPWPPRSAKHSVRPVIDVVALNATVRGNSVDGGA